MKKTYKKGTYFSYIINTIQNCNQTLEDLDYSVGVATEGKKNLTKESIDKKLQEGRGGGLSNRIKPVEFCNAVQILFSDSKEALSGFSNRLYIELNADKKFPEKLQAYVGKIIDEKNFDIEIFKYVFITLIELDLENKDKKSAVSKPALASNIKSVSLPKMTFGREELIKEICASFEESNAVFLTGMDGMGKTHLAKTYAGRCKKSYKTIVYGEYAGSLAQLISDDSIFRIDGMTRKIKQDGEKQTDDEYARDKIEVIRSISDEQTLIVIDGYNTANGDELHSVLFKNPNFRILVTANFDQQDEYRQIPVGPINDDVELKKLTEYYCGDFHDPEAEDERAFAKLMRLTGRHTLSVELTAIYMRENSLTVAEMTEQLGNDENMFSAMNDTRLTRDHESKMAVEYIKKLFSLSELSESAQSFMRYMYLVPTATGIPDRMAKELMGVVYRECKIPLVERHLVSYNVERKSLSLHPVIKLAVKEALSPELESCKPFIMRFYEYLNDMKWQNYTSEIKRACGEISTRIHRYVPCTRDSFMLLHETAKALYYADEDVIAGHLREKNARLPLYDFACSAYGADSLEACSEAIQIGHMYLVRGDRDEAYKWQYERAYSFLEANEGKYGALPLYWDLRERSANQMGNLYARGYGCEEGINEQAAVAYFEDGIRSTEMMKPHEKMSEGFIKYKSLTALHGLCKVYYRLENARLFGVNVERYVKTLEEIKALEGRDLGYDNAYVKEYEAKKALLDRNYSLSRQLFEEALRERSGYKAFTYTDVDILLNILRCYESDEGCFAEGVLKDKVLADFRRKLELAEKYASLLYIEGHRIFGIIDGFKRYI